MTVLAIVIGRELDLLSARNHFYRKKISIKYRKSHIAILPEKG
jgi:hypothetical protein